MTDLLDRIASVLTASEKQQLAQPVGLVTPVAPYASPTPGGGPGQFAISGFKNRYSTMDPWNCGRFVTDSGLVLQGPNGTVSLFTGEGSGGWLIPGINHSSEYLWSRTDPRLLYFVVGNELRWLDTGDFPNRGIIHKFTEYDRITGMGESDISPDGTTMVFCGDDRDVFTYNLVTGAKSNVAPALPALDSLYITDNFVLQSSKEKGVGIHAYSALTMKHLGQIAPASGHMDVTGDDLIWTNAGDPNPLDGFQNGIIKIRIEDGKQTGLVALGWSKKQPPTHWACHISCQDNGPALVSTYCPLDPNNDEPLSNDLLLVELDGSGFRNLGKHGAAAVDHTKQPLAALSHDGKRMIWNTADGCCIEVLA